MSQRFCDVLVVRTSFGASNTCLKQLKLWKVATEVGSIVVVGALTHCAWPQSMCDLKAVQMNVQSSQIQEQMLYKFELGYNSPKATKNIFHVKDEGAVDHNTLTR